MRISILVLFVVLFSACRNRAAINNDLKKYFDEHKVDGCFTMYDNSNGQVTVYNLGLDTSRFLPASTFKIVNSLVGLQTGKILSDTMSIAWDGVQRKYPDGSDAVEWNKTLNFNEAFRASAVPYFQEVARRIGYDTMRMWIDTLGYGNKMMSKNIDSFWLDNSLKISPDEQLGLVKKLYFDQLPFRKAVQQSVKNAMQQEQNSAYSMSYKTGWGHDEKNVSTGWLTGWVEENNHVYFFTTLVRSNDPAYDMKDVRLDISKKILKELGVLKP